MLKVYIHITIYVISGIKVIRKQGRKFLAVYPLLGRRVSPLPLRYQQRSVYYWWWQYLRRNQPYLHCCERGGKGKMVKLYADFGDVRGDDFRVWWQLRGEYLFAEAATVSSMSELGSVADWNNEWVDGSTMVVAIPMTWSKRDIKKALDRLLKKRHSRRRGRLPLRRAKSSTARYPLAQNFAVHSLGRDLAVYDARLAAQAEAQHAGKRCKTWYEIGCELKLVPTAILSADARERGITDTGKVNTMTVAASRAFKRAAQRVASVGWGVFP